MVVQVPKQVLEFSQSARQYFNIPVEFLIKQIDQSKGYLLSPGIGELFRNNRLRTAPMTMAPDTFIHRYADVAPENRDSMFWTFDLEMARAWVNYHIAPDTLGAVGIEKSLTPRRIRARPAGRTARILRNNIGQKKGRALRPGTVYYDLNGKMLGAATLPDGHDGVVLEMKP